MSWAKVNEERREGALGKGYGQVKAPSPGAGAIGRRIAAKGGK